ncbi:MAG: hypothetical protein EOM63_03825 [Clostridia bacterium]|nr:hypothetical protein [Clostridia bacterium]
MLQRNKKQLPDKTTLNLAMREQDAKTVLQVVPSILAVLAIIFIVGKFAVADRIAGVMRAQAVLTDTKTQISQLTEQNAEYDKVLAEYSKYAANYLTDEERQTVDRLAVMRMVENDLMGDAQIEQYSIADNVLSIDFSGVTLAQAANFVKRLESHSEVAAVQVNTVNSRTTADAPSVSMVITLKNDAGHIQAPEKATAQAANKATGNAAAEGDTG